MGEAKLEAEERRRKELCDLVLERAVAMMAEAEAPAEMIVDRLLTYAGAQICLRHGSVQAAEIFRDLADRIDRGVFHRITGEGARH